MKHEIWYQYQCIQPQKLNTANMRSNHRYEIQQIWDIQPKIWFPTNMISLVWRNIISNCTSYDVNVGLKEFIDSLLTAIRKDLNSEKDQIHQLSRNLFAKPVSPYHFWLCNWSGHRHNMTAAVCQSGTPGDPRLPSRRSSSTRNNGTPTGENIEMGSKAGRHFHFPRIHPNMYPFNMYPPNMYPSNMYPSNM